MAGKLLTIILAGSLGLAAQTGQTQDNPPPMKRPAEERAPLPPPPAFNKQNVPEHPFRPGFDPTGARRIYEKLPPEDKQRVRENLERWKEMSPEERETMRVREQQRRQKMLKETNDAIASSGLKLDADQRQVYALRYAQERRKVEEKLRKEMEEKRKTLIEEVIQALKAEFNRPPAPSPATTP